MVKIVIIGSGVMGSSIAVPAADNGHDVLLVGSPLDDDIIATISKPGGVHPKLDSPLPANVVPMRCDALRSEHLDAADVIIAGVSSPGVGWFVEYLNDRLKVPKPVAFVTKGLDTGPSGLATYAGTLPGQIPSMADFIGIGGPCIARELANRQPTASIYASADGRAADWFARMMETPYYRLSTTSDVYGVEACAPLKNFYAIGVSAMQTRYRDDKRADGQAKNPCAAVFSQAVFEMAALAEVLGGTREAAFGLAGVGDLHVTVGGGRNSRLGHGLGEDRTVSSVLSAELAGETVEGVDTARMLELYMRTPEAQGRYPLAEAIIRAVLDDDVFRFDFASLRFAMPV